MQRTIVAPAVLTFAAFRGARKSLESGEAGSIPASQFSIGLSLASLAVTSSRWVEPLPGIETVTTS